MFAINRIYMSPNDHDHQVILLLLLLVVVVVVVVSPTNQVFF